MNNRVGWWFRRGWCLQKSNPQQQLCVTIQRILRKLWSKHSSTEVTPPHPPRALNVVCRGSALATRPNPDSHRRGYWGLRPFLCEGCVRLGARTGPSMIQATRVNNLNSMHRPSPRITTSTHETSRSSTTTRRSSWSHGTQLWTASLSTRGNRSLFLLAIDLKINKTTTNAGLWHEQ